MVLLHVVNTFDASGMPLVFELNVSWDLDSDCTDLLIDGEDEYQDHSSDY